EPAADAAAAEAAAAELADVAERRERAIVTALDLWNRALEGAYGGNDWPEVHAAIIRLGALLGHADVVEDALARAQAATRDPAHAVTLALRRADLVLAPGHGEPDPALAEEIIREAAFLAAQDPRPLVRFVH